MYYSVASNMIWIAIIIIIINALHAEILNDITINVGVPNTIIQVNEKI